MKKPPLWKPYSINLPPITLGTIISHHLVIASKPGAILLFVRATSRTDAKNKVREYLPLAKFYR